MTIGDNIKGISEALKTGSKIVDFLPIAGLDDIGAAATRAIAGGVEAVGDLLNGDAKSAGRALVANIGAAGVALAPGLEYTQAAGIDLAGAAEKTIKDKMGGTKPENLPIGYTPSASSTPKVPGLETGLGRLS